MRGFSPCRHSITHKREAGLRLPPLDKSTFCHSFFSMTEGAFLWLFSGFAFMPGGICMFLCCLCLADAALTRCCPQPGRKQGEAPRQRCLHAARCRYIRRSGAGFSPIRHIVVPVMQFAPFGLYRNLTRDVNPQRHFFCANASKRIKVK